MTAAVSMFEEQFTPAARYGVRPGAAPSADPAAAGSRLTKSSMPSADGIDLSKMWRPDHPLFWVGALMAATFGLVFFSTTVRLGPVTASGSIGDK